MGSQSVTDFSTAKKKLIRELVGSYSPHSSKAEKQASDIAAAAVGTLAGEKNEFLQAMSSRSVETGLDLITFFADELRAAKDPEQVYEKYGVGSEKRQPSGIVSALLTNALSYHLTTAQKETESAFAAKDAIPKTIIDVVSRAFQQKKEPTDVNRQEFAEAFRKVRREDIATAFMQNVASALINLALDATRGPTSPARVAELKKRIRRDFVPELVHRLLRGK
jgi:hypothetical protein